MCSLFWDLVRLNEAGESNWWSGVQLSLNKYKLPTDLDVIKAMSKDVFSNKVKKAVAETALGELLTECRGLKKTSCLQYKDLKVQEYWSHLYPSQAKLLFKWRSQTLDLKTHLTYKYSDTLCRSCEINDETPEHALNCGMVVGMEPKINIMNIDKMDEFTKSELKQMVLRISSFLERVAEDEK